MKPTKKAIIGLFVAVPIIWCIAWFFLSFIATPEARGQFGDMFGAVNALFSGWAFVGVIVAILLQKEELELQRKELKETRKEFKDQNETMKRQRFENTFFNMMSLLNETVNSFQLNLDVHGSAEGRDTFSLMQKRMHTFWEQSINHNHGQTIQNIYETSYVGIFQGILGHYFRNLYRIIKFVDESDLKDEEKSLYVKIVRAQLSNQELFLLFYNCAYYEEGLNFKVYVEKYALLNNFPLGDLLHEDHAKEYSLSAYNSL